MIQNLRKGQIFGWASHAFFPGQKELSIAVGEAATRIDSKLNERIVNPIRRTLKFGIGSDGSLVYDQMTCRFASLSSNRLRPLGPELFISEDRPVPQPQEYLGHGVPIVDMGLCLNADLVPHGVAFADLVGLPLMRHSPKRTILPQPQQLALITQGACGCVVECVLLECAGSIEAESQGGQHRLEGSRIGDGELQFDLGSLHPQSIRRIRRTGSA